MNTEHHTRCHYGQDMGLACTCELERGWDDVMTLAPSQTDDELTAMLEDMAIEHGGNMPDEVSREEVAVFCDRYLEWPLAEHINTILSAWSDRLNPHQMEGLNRFIADADLASLAVEQKGYAQKKLDTVWAEYRQAVDKLESLFNRYKGAQIELDEASQQVASRLESLKASEDAFLGLFLPGRLCQD